MYNTYILYITMLKKHNMMNTLPGRDGMVKARRTETAGRFKRPILLSYKSCRRYTALAVRSAAQRHNDRHQKIVL